MSPRHQHQQLRHQIHRLQHRLRLRHDQGPRRAFRQRKEDASLNSHHPGQSSSHRPDQAAFRIFCYFNLDRLNEVITILVSLKFNVKRLNARAALVVKADGSSNS